MGECSPKVPMFGATSTVFRLRGAVEERPPTPRGGKDKKRNNLRRGQRGTEGMATSEAGVRLATLAPLLQGEAVEVVGKIQRA